MGSTVIDALRVSVNYTSVDWNALDKENPHHWADAVAIVKDRLNGRYLDYSSQCLESPNSGFIVLSIDCLIIETVQQFREGLVNEEGARHSARLVKAFLSGARFQPYFARQARNSFYTDIRCGLLHQAEARNMWLIRRQQNSMLQEFPGGDGYIIDIVLFHKAPVSYTHLTLPTILRV